MENEAAKRKQRLLTLKRKVAGDTSNPDVGEIQNPEPQGEHSLEEPLKKPAFRNYNPLDSSLQDVVLPKAKPVDLEEHIEEQLEASKDTSVTEEMDLTTLAPRKVDWDLKRDAEKKLQRLERRTQRAIAELIRERLASGKQDLLVSAVNMTSAATEQSHDSDED